MSWTPMAAPSAVTWSAAGAPSGPLWAAPAAGTGAWARPSSFASDLGGTVAPIVRFQFRFRDQFADFSFTDTEQQVNFTDSTTGAP